MYRGHRPEQGYGQWCGTVVVLSRDAAIPRLRRAGDRRRLRRLTRLRWRPKHWRQGTPISGYDAQIAAICRAHDARLATRDEKDLAGVGVEPTDPWSAG
jgi:predicted nucleic acid-binding protein